MHIYTHIYAHIYIHTHSYTYTHIHTHTHNILKPFKRNTKINKFTAEKSLCFTQTKQKYIKSKCLKTSQTINI